MNNIKKQLAPILKKLLPLLSKNRYAFIGLFIIVLFYATLTRINSIVEAPRDEQKYQESITGLKRVKFSDDSIEKIKNLRDVEVDVEPSFPSSRENPFE